MRFGNTNAGRNANQKTTQGANPNESDLLEMTNSALRAYHRIQRPGVLVFSTGFSEASLNESAGATALPAGMDSAGKE
jgi:hypothetical protein